MPKGIMGGKRLNEFKHSSKIELSTQGLILPGKFATLIMTLKRLTIYNVSQYFVLALHGCLRY